MNAFISPDPVMDQRAYELVRRLEEWHIARLAELDRAYEERLRARG